MIGVQDNFAILISVPKNKITYHQALRYNTVKSLVLASARIWLTSEEVLTIREPGGD